VHISWFRRNASKHANLLHAQTFVVAVYMLAANEGMRQCIETVSEKFRTAQVSIRSYWVVHTIVGTCPVSGLLQLQFLRLQVSCMQPQLHVSISVQ